MLRCFSRHLAPLISSRTLHSIGRSAPPPNRVSPFPATLLHKWISSQPSKSAAEAALRDDDEDLGIATGLELEELLAEREGKKRFDLEPPRGPFGTKESPAIIPSNFDERIVGCSGGIGEDEHDVVWFKLKKGELYECTVCTQVFKLEVQGGRPAGHHHH